MNPTDRAFELLDLPTFAQIAFEFSLRLSPIAKIRIALQETLPPISSGGMLWERHEIQ